MRRSSHPYPVSSDRDSGRREVRWSHGTSWTVLTDRALWAPSVKAGIHMDATHFDTFTDALIDDLAVAAPDGQGERRLFDLLDSPRRIVDEQSLLAVLVAAVTARNLFDHVIAQAVAAAERAGDLWPASTCAREPICSPAAVWPPAWHTGLRGWAGQRTPCRR